MKFPRVAATTTAALAVALAAPAASPAASALTQSLGEATVGSSLKALSTLAGRGNSSCVASTQASNPFAAWGDSADYVPAPGGSFESGAPHQWTTAGRRRSPRRTSHGA